MTDILTLEDLKGFYPNIKLSPPVALQGGQTYTSKLYSYDHLLNKNPLYFYTLKCKCKNGVVVSDRKCYIDLVFNSSDDGVISSIEGLEKYLQNCVVENSSEWFENSVTLDDVELSFLNSLRPYQSAKKLVLRCNVGTLNTIENTVRVYNEEGDDLTYKEITNETEMICIIHISALRFTSKNFMIDYVVKQIMVLDNNDINSKKLIINNKEKTVDTPLEKEKISLGIRAVKHQGAIVDKEVSTVNENDTLHKRETNESPMEKSPMESNDGVNVNSAIHNQGNEKEKTDTVEDSDVIKGDLDAVEVADAGDATLDEREVSIDGQDTEDDEDSEDDEDTEETGDLNDVEDVEDVENIENGQHKQGSEYLDSTNKKPEENDDLDSLEELEVGLEELEIGLEDLDDITDDSSLAIKQPETIYGTLYKNAKKKAYDDHKKALTSFLKLNEIKTKINTV